MFEQLFNQFVIAFREGIEASLVIATVMMALKQRGAQRLAFAAKTGIWTALIVCAVGGYMLGTIALVNNHGLELILYGAACITVLTMVFWMARTGKNLRAGIQSRVSDLSSRKGFLPMLGMFTFVFFMISREGFEMMLLLLAFGAGKGGYLYVISMLMGIGLAVLVGYAIMQGVLKINLGKFLQYTAFVLILFVVQLVFDVLHEGYEGGFFPEPSNQAWTNFVDYAHDQVPIFSYAGLALFSILVLYFFSQALFTKNDSRKSPALVNQSNPVNVQA
jgi:high-affinity iron transporter